MYQEEHDSLRIEGSLAKEKGESLCPSSQSKKGTESFLSGELHKVGLNSCMMIFKRRRSSVPASSAIAPRGMSRRVLKRVFLDALLPPMVNQQTVKYFFTLTKSQVSNSQS